MDISEENLKKLENEERTEIKRLQKIAEDLPETTRMCKIAFRVNTNEYKELMNNVKKSVLGPLQKYLINISQKNAFRMSLVPSVGNLPANDTGASLWKQYNALPNVSQGGAGVTMQCTLKFFKR